MRRAGVPRPTTAVLAGVLLAAALGAAAAPDRAPTLAAVPSAWGDADLRDPGPRAKRVVAAAQSQVGRTLTYDPAYATLAYPGGDVPLERGVCSDVVVRALRGAGLDLQQAVHEDMRRHFRAYPQHWSLARPDRNIDHRRVPNLETFFARAGHELPAGTAWRPGDVVSWRLGNGLAHIGIVSDRRDASGRWLIVHNIGAGARVEAPGADWTAIGHYRLPATDAPAAAPRSR